MPPAPDWWDPSESLAVNSVLNAVHDEQAADADFLASCDRCMVALQEVCSAALGVEEFKVAPFDWTPDVRLERFGSTLQGVALKTSDLDVRMTFEQFCVHGQEKQMRYLKAVAVAVAGGAVAVAGGTEAVPGAAGGAAAAKGGAGTAAAGAAAAGGAAAASGNKQATPPPPPKPVETPIVASPDTYILGISALMIVSVAANTQGFFGPW